MCGIVGGVTNKIITPLLLEGLKRLEYRGYDSSGLIVLSPQNSFDRARSVGKVSNLEKNLNQGARKLMGTLELLIQDGQRMESHPALMLIHISQKIM